MLDKTHDTDLQVLVVWEPILPTDWERPTNSVLARLHDPRILQFWDHDHLIAHEISRELAADPGGPKPRCCSLRGNLWDFVGLYPKGSRWQEGPPKAVFANGTVDSSLPGLAKELTLLLGLKDQANAD